MVGEPEVEVTFSLSFLLISILGDIMFLITSLFINQSIVSLYTPVHLGNTAVLLSSGVRPAVCTDH